jgi:hypothetical protein
MNIDPKIKDLSKIYNVFNRNSVTGNKQGYFANSLSAFSDLKNCVDGNLVAIDNDSERPFLSGVVDGGCIIKGNFSYFTSVDNVKTEKKFRPYTIAEFQRVFTIGRPIRYRIKNQPDTEKLLIFNGYARNNNKVYIYIGCISYTLEQLFDDFEWQEYYPDDYKPFGMEDGD